MEVVAAAESAQAEATLLGVYVGAAIAFLGTLLGNVVAPLLHDWAKDMRAARHAARIERREGLKAISDAALEASLDAPPEGIRTSEHIANMRAVIRGIHHLDLGIGHAANLYTIDKLMDGAHLPEGRVDESTRWLLFFNALERLARLVDEPQTYEVASEAMLAEIEAETQKRESVPPETA